MFKFKSRKATPAPAKEFERLISAESRLTTMLRDVALRAASVIKKAKADAADIEAKATQEAEVEIDRLKIDLATEQDAALRRLAAEADRRDWTMGPEELNALADRLVLELLASREKPR
jgi:hypothetical protein